MQRNTGPLKEPSTSRERIKFKIRDGCSQIAEPYYASSSKHTVRATAVDVPSSDDDESLPILQPRQMSK